MNFEHTLYIYIWITREETSLTRDDLRGMIHALVRQTGSVRPKVSPISKNITRIEIFLYFFKKYIFPRGPYFWIYFKNSKLFCLRDHPGNRDTFVRMCPFWDRFAGQRDKASIFPLESSMYRVTHPATAIWQRVRGEREREKNTRTENFIARSTPFCIRNYKKT